MPKQVILYHCFAEGSYEYQLDDKVTIEEKVGVKATVKTEARQVNRTKLKQFEQVTINAPAIWLIKGDFEKSTQLFMPAKH